MTLPTRLALYALAAAILATERGRSILGSTLVHIGSEMMPPVHPDPAREHRITERIVAELARMAPTTYGRNGNGHRPPPL